MNNTSPLCSLACAAALCLTLCLHPSAHAQEAAFSADGKHVYYLRMSTSVIVDIDLGAKPGEEWNKYDLQEDLGDEQSLVSISRDKEGGFILANDKALFTWKPGEKLKKSLRLPEALSLTEFAQDPKSGLRLAPGLVDQGEAGMVECLFIRKGDDDTFALDEGLPQGMKSPRFDAGGRLFFGMDATLYTGAWISQADGGPDLVAWPVAPLDVPGLDGGTSNDELAINGIAPAGKWVYATLVSDVDAILVRLPRPAVDAETGLPAGTKELTRKAQWKRFSATLATVEAYGSESEPYFSTLRALCASPDGTVVFYSGIPMLHLEREEYWTRSVKSGEQKYHGSNPLE